MDLIKQELTNLSTLCFELNAPDFHVMFELAGHVGVVSVRVYLGGWHDGAFPHYYGSVSMCDIWESTAYRALLQTQAELTKINEEYRNEN